MKRSTDPRVILGLLLGMLVGRVLGAFLANSGARARVALTVLGVMLGSGPMLLWPGILSAKIVYALGFVVGLLAERLAQARTTSAENEDAAAAGPAPRRWLAWIDFAVISSSMALALAIAAKLVG